MELAGLGASLAISAYPTLELLELRTIVKIDDYDRLGGLSRELKFIAGNNILKELELCLVIRDPIWDYESPLESKDCSAFDSVLTESGAFPMLHRVSVDIYWRPAPNDVSYLDAMLESLKKDNFPRLVKSKAVKFDFCSLFRVRR